MKNLGATECNIQMCFVKDKYEMIMLARDMWECGNPIFDNVHVKGELQLAAYLLH